MLTRDAATAPVRYVPGRGTDLHRMGAADVVNTVTAWYESDRAEDVDLDEDGDMLFFQWGTYDWGDGPSFQYDITRQFTASTPEV